MINGNLKYLIEVGEVIPLLFCSSKQLDTSAVGKNHEKSPNLSQYLL
jgi:hypothetical protein